MRTMLNVAAALCLGVTASNAAIIEQTQSFPTHTPDGAYTLTFDKYNGNLADLISVEVIFSLYMYGGSVSVDNDSTFAKSATANIRVRGDLSGSVALINGAFQNAWADVQAVVSETYNLGVTTGDAVNEFNNTGLDDVRTFVGPDAQNAVSHTHDDFVHSVVWNQYVDHSGTGTYNLNVGTQQASNANGGVQYAVTLMQTYGTVTVRYETIPEPATAGLAGVAALMLIRRRRRA